jgi:hypothetical protein
MATAKGQRPTTAIRFMVRHRFVVIGITLFLYLALGAYLVVIHNPLANRNTYFIGGEGVSRIPPRHPTPLILVEWPSEMDSQSSDHISISLVPPNSNDFQSHRSANPNTHGFIVATPIPIGTPNAPLATSFGSRSAVSVSATLASTGLDVGGSALDGQVPVSSALTWDWSIEPKNPGWHAASGSIYLSMKDPGGTDTRSYLLWSGDLYVHAIAVPGSVFFNLLTTGFGAVIALLGVLATPIFGLLRASNARNDRTPPQSTGG